MFNKGGLSGYLTLLAVFWLTLVGTALAGNIDGTVSNSSGKTGRVYINLLESGSFRPLDNGVSIADPGSSAPGSFSIRGVPDGTYQVGAFLDATGYGLSHTSDPLASPVTVTITGGSATPVELVIAPPNPATLPTPPAFFQAFPIAESALLLWEPQRDQSEFNTAESFLIEWSSDDFATITGSRDVPVTRNGNFLAVPGLTTGETYRFRISGKIGAVATTPQVSAPLLIQAAGSGSIVSGTINLDQSYPGANLLVILAGQNFNQFSATAILNPEINNAYSITGVPAGNYRLMAFLDLNNNGVMDPGEAQIPDGMAQQVNVNGSDSVNAGVTTLPTVASFDQLVTIHSFSNFYPAGPEDRYAVRLRVDGNARVPVNVLLIAGPGVTGPTDMGLSPYGAFSAWLNRDTTRPASTDSYQLEVYYADAPLTAVPVTLINPLVRDNMPLDLLPAGSLTESPSTFSWNPSADPAPVAKQRLSLSPLSDNCQRSGQIWSKEELSPVSFSVSYDGGQLLDGNYEWEVSAIDPFDNSASTVARFNIGAVAPCVSGGGGGGGWTVNSANPTPPPYAIDWFAFQHGPVSAGNFLRINGTYYLVVSSGDSPWNGTGFTSAEIVACNQLTGEPTGAVINQDLLLNKQIELFSSLPTPPPPVDFAFVAGSPLGSNANIHTAIKSEFTRPLNPESVSPATFSVTDQNTAVVDGIFSVYGNSVSFVPTEPLVAGMQYSVAINGVTAMDGTPLPGTPGWSFTTANPSFAPSFQEDFLDYNGGLFLPHRDTNGTETQLLYENIMDWEGDLYGELYSYSDGSWDWADYGGYRYVLDSSGNWQESYDDPSFSYIADYNADGSVTLQSYVDDHREVIIPEEFALDGQAVNAYLPPAGFFASPGAVFPEGSKAYRLTFARLGDSYELEADTSLTWFDGSNNWNVNSLSDLQTIFAAGGSNYLHRDRYTFQLGADQSVSVFEYGQTGLVSLPAKGSWELRTVNGAELLVAYLPAAYQATINESGDAIFAAFGEGQVYQGLWHHAGEVEAEQGYAYNNTAFSAFIENFVPVSFSASVANTDGQAVSSVRVSMVGYPQIMTFIDDEDGYFSLPALPSGIPFALKLERSDYVPTYTANFTTAEDIYVSESRAFNLLTPQQYGSFSNTPGAGLILGRPVDSNNPDLIEFAADSITAVNKSTSEAYAVMVNPDGSFLVKDIPAGQTVIVSGTKSGWSFAPAEFTVHADSVSMGAVFGADSFPLNVTVDPSSSGSGSISSDPAGILMVSYQSFGNAFFPANIPVTLTVVPDAGSVFTGWGGACIGITGQACTVTMDRVRDVTVSFQLQVSGVTMQSSALSPQVIGTQVDFSAYGEGGNGNYEYQFWLWNGNTWSLAQNYGPGNSWTMPGSTPIGAYTVQVNVRTPGSPAEHEAVTQITNFLVAASQATSVSLSASPAIAQTAGNAVTFMAVGQGSSNYEYEFWLWNGTDWSKVQNYSAADTWIMPDTTPVGEYTIQVNVRGAGTAAESDAAARVTGYRITSAAAASVSLTATPANSQTFGNPVSFKAAGQGSTGYEYEFWLWDGVSWSLKQAYSSVDTWVMPATTPIGLYTVQVNVRGAGSSTEADQTARIVNYRVTAPTATGVTLDATPASSQAFGSTVSFKAAGQGSTAYEYEFWIWDGTAWCLKQAYSPVDTWVIPDTTPAGLYTIQVNVRGAGSAVESDGSARVSNYQITP